MPLLAVALRSSQAGCWLTLDALDDVSTVSEQCGCAASDVAARAWHSTKCMHVQAGVQNRDCLIQSAGILRLWRACRALPLSSLPLARHVQRGKPAGIKAGRKLQKHRKIERWASKVYSKAHSITHLKANP